MNRTALLSTTLLSTALVAAPLAGVASADDSAADERAGATFGVGLSGGNMGCSTDDGDDCGDDDTNAAGGVSLRAGWMVSPSIAITGDAWAMTHQDDRLTVSQGILAASLRGWVAPRLWLQGGVGVARATAEYDLGIGEVMSESDTVPAVAGGVGVEVVRTPAFGVDVELKGGTGVYEDDILVYQVALGAGVSFY